MVNGAARLWPARPAMIFEDRRWTWVELAAEVDRVAKGLMAAGVASGDHLAIWMTNRPEWVFTMFAAGKVGACLVPLNTRYRADDAAFTVADSQASLMITLDRSGPIDFAAMLQDARSQIEAAGHLRRIVVLDTTGGQGLATVPGAATWDELVAGGAAVTDAALAERAASVSVDQLTHRK